MRKSNIVSIYVPNWFLKKKGINRSPNCLDGIISKETNKAILLKVNPIICLYHQRNDYCKHGIWIPKSIIERIESIYFKIN